MENSQLCASSSSASASNLNPLSIGADCWLAAEQSIQEVLCSIQPTVASEQRRKEVIDFIRELISGYCTIEVFEFGSVPLKTYLPDGDIDFTALCYQNMEDKLAKNICDFLEGEGQKDAKFQVSNVHYIPAQVKIVKCTVEGMSIDISFNQLAGLCALRFLEQADDFIKDEHLFKRSVILIKAWCYYESRILGAYYGLISTYALEIMVLHIISLFHRSLCGPLSVLYWFLDYYSTFDWEHCCVGITGPVALSSLSEGMVSPKNCGNELLLSEEFIKICKELFTIPISAPETRESEFPVKYLNIMDPLKSSNNLGRSVSKGNYHRIRRAFSFGSEKLKGILRLPREFMFRELKKFFVNTVKRNGSGLRADVCPLPTSNAEQLKTCDLKGDCSSYFIGLQHGQQYHNYMVPLAVHLYTTLSSTQLNNSIASDGQCQLAWLNHSGFPWRNRNVFGPRPSSCHRGAFQLSGTSFDVNSKTLCLGAGTGLSNMGVEDKVMSQGTGRCIPGIGILETTRSRGTGAFLPNVNVEEIAGKKTDAANNVQYSCAPMKLWQKANGKATCQGMPVEEVGSSGQGTTSKTDEDGNSSDLNLSLEEFPLLPGSKNPAELQHPVLADNPTFNSQPANNDSAPVEFDELETFQPSSSEQTAPVASEQPNSADPVCVDCPLVGPSRAMPRQQELQEGDEKVVQPPYHLKDEKDFPPLPYHLKDEDFPPLSL